MSRVALWWRALRPFAFSASVVSALLGGLVAVARTGARLHFGHYLAAVFGAACAHAAANLLNDYCDYRNGVDRSGTLGSSGVLTAGLMTPRAVLHESLFFWGLAALLGLYFLVAVGPFLWPLFVVGGLLGIGYTVGPLHLKYRAFGDLAVFAAFGVGITLGSYAIQTGRFSWVPVAYSLPVSFLVAAILHGNNLRDALSDRSAGIVTLAMRLGPRRGWRFYLLLLGLAYFTLLVFISAGVITPVGFITLFSLPLAWQIVRRFGPRADARVAPAAAAGPGDAVPPALVLIDVRTARLHMVFGLLLTLAVLIAAVLR